MKKYFLIFALCTNYAQADMLTPQVKNEVFNAMKSRAGHVRLEGTTWKLVDRFCAPGTNEGDMSTPTKVYDISVYHQTWTFENGKQTFQIHNATFDSNKCSTRIDGDYGYVDIPNMEPIAVLGTSTTRRRRVDCAATYPGPLLGLLHVLSWEGTDTFRVMTLGTSIAPVPIACPNAGDYLITKWKKYQEAP